MQRDDVGAPQKIVERDKLDQLFTRYPSLAYDLWGDAVDLASRVRRAVDAPGVYVSDAVHDRVHGLWEFTEVGAVDASGRTSAVWRVTE